MTARLYAVVSRWMAAVAQLVERLGWYQEYESSNLFGRPTKNYGLNLRITVFSGCESVIDLKADFFRAAEKLTTDFDWYAFTNPHSTVCDIKRETGSARVASYQERSAPGARERLFTTSSRRTIAAKPLES